MPLIAFSKAPEIRISLSAKKDINGILVFRFSNDLYPKQGLCFLQVLFLPLSSPFLGLSIVILNFDALFPIGVIFDTLIMMHDCVKDLPVKNIPFYRRWFTCVSQSDPFAQNILFEGEK